MRPATGEWFDDLTGAATGPVSEAMRPVVGPARPPPPGLSRRSAPDEMARERIDYAENNWKMNGEAPASPTVPVAAAAARRSNRRG